MLSLKDRVFGGLEMVVDMKIPEEHPYRTQYLWFKMTFNIIRGKLENHPDDVLVKIRRFLQKTVRTLESFLNFDWEDEAILARVEQDDAYLKERADKLLSIIEIRMNLRGLFDSYRKIDFRKLYKKEYLKCTDSVKANTGKRYLAQFSL